MQIVIEIQAPDWDDREAGRAGQYQRNAVAKLVRDIADRIQIGSARVAEFDRAEAGLFATFRMETDEQPRGKPSPPVKRAAGETNTQPEK